MRGPVDQAIFRQTAHGAVPAAQQKLRPLEFAPSRFTFAASHGDLRSGTICSHLVRIGNFEAFASLNGPSFYGMAPNEERITLEKAPVDVPREVDGGAAPIVPFNAGETLAWRLVS